MKPLDSLAKRDLLAAEKYDSDEVLQYADDFLAQERYGDAFEFYWKLRNRPGLSKTKEAAIQVGDTDVLWRMAHHDPEMVSRDDWISCARSAMRLAKFHSAAYAHERAGDAAGKAAAEKEMTASREGMQDPSPRTVNSPSSQPQSPDEPAPE